MLRIALCSLLLVVARGFAEPASLAPEDPVLFVYGACSDAGKVSTDGCAVTLSRQEFDNLISTLSPGQRVTPTMRNRLARTYAELLALDAAARELGIDNSPEYHTTMRWLQAKTLADMLRRRLEKESSMVSEAEIAAYYREQLQRFEEVKLSRLVLPKNKFGADDQQKAEQAAQRIAADIRERAAHGEDFPRLQKEAYDMLGFSGLPPATDMGNRRRASLPAGLVEEIFSLQPGEVSKVEDETHSFVIYKVEVKQTLPEEQVKEEITREVAKEKLERSLRAITERVRTELNETYFGEGEESNEKTQ